MAWGWHSFPVLSDQPFGQTGSSLLDGAEVDDIRDVSVCARFQVCWDRSEARKIIIHKAPGGLWPVFTEFNSSYQHIIEIASRLWCYRRHDESKAIDTHPRSATKLLDILVAWQRIGQLGVTLVEESGPLCRLSVCCASLTSSNLGFSLKLHW